MRWITLLFAGLLLTGCGRDGRNHWKPWALESLWGSSRPRHQGPTVSSEFAADGRHVLSTADDGTVRLWLATDGSEDVRFTGPAVSGAFLGSDRVVVGGGMATGQRTVAVVCDRATGRAIARHPHRGDIRAVAGNNAGTLAASFGSLDQHLDLWSATDGALIHRWEKRLSAVRRLWFTADGSGLVAYQSAESPHAVGGEAHVGLYVFAVGDGRLRHAITLPQTNAPAMVAAAPAEDWAVIVREDMTGAPQGQVLVCDLARGPVTATGLCPGRPSGVCIRADGAVFIATSVGVMISDRALTAFSRADVQATGPIAASADGRWIVDGDLRWWNAADGKPRPDPHRRTWPQRVTSHGGLVLSQHKGEGLWCWSPGRSEPLWTVRIPDATAIALAGPTADDALAVEYATSGPASFFRGTKRNLAIDWAWGLAFSPSCRWAVVRDEQGIQVIDLRGPEPTAVAVPIPDGFARCAVVSDDGAVQVLLEVRDESPRWWSRTSTGAIRSRVLDIPALSQWKLSPFCERIAWNDPSRLLLPIEAGPSRGWALFPWTEGDGPLVPSQTGSVAAGEFITGIAIDGAQGLALLKDGALVHVHTLEGGRMTRQQTLRVPAGPGSWHLRSDQPGLLVTTTDGTVRAYGPGKPVPAPSMARVVSSIRP